MSRKGNNRKKSGTKDVVVKLDHKIEGLLNSYPLRSFTIKGIVKKLGFQSKQINNQIPMVVSRLAKENRIKVTENGSYRSNKKAEMVAGKVDHVSSKFAYILMSDEEDIFVRSRDLKGAMHGDLVEVSVFSTRHGLKKEGKVLHILERSQQIIVGRLQISRGYGFIIPDNKKIHEDLFIPMHHMMDAQHGDKVMAEIVVYPGQGKKAEGKVTRVLGPAGNNEAEIHSIMAEYGLPFEFPDAVEAEAKRISDDTSKEISKRKDLRNVLTFTIDPEDAKDFDDAISFKLLENGNYEIGVHIADVTHYVRENTLLEEEALHRATSVYLVDRTIPMLPERLSNELCSLRPNEDKLTFSAIFEMDANARILNKWFGRTIIHSDRRFTYEDAQFGIENGEGDYFAELITLNELAKQLRERRFQNGAVNFETTEVRFRLDEEGKPLEVVPRIRKDAHKLIEEFMLLANRSVATFIYKMKEGKQRNTFVYRTHDNPDPEKIADFSLFAMRFGHKINPEGGKLSNALNTLMAEIEGKPEEGVLQNLAIRSMAKAKYTTEATGHFGLAFDHYTHFTSPIRRYPDMMVHRLLWHYLNSGKSANQDEYEDKCSHSSEREKRAAEAERASVKYKQVEFMSTMEGRDFEGIISGVTEWGIYVELIETRCEGMVRLSDMRDDFYDYDEKNFRIVGSATGNEYTLGDKVKVRIKSTDIDKRLIDLEMVW